VSAAGYFFQALVSDSEEVYRDDNAMPPSSSLRVPLSWMASPRRLNHALILAIAQAKTWMSDLRSGRYASTADIARCLELSDAHVRRTLRFGYLAPDIIEAIVEGRQPRILTVKMLLQEIPCAWPGQRLAFGFAG
jgi:hypothetical protein